MLRRRMQPLDWYLFLLGVMGLIQFIIIIWWDGRSANGLKSAQVPCPHHHLKERYTTFRPPDIPFKHFTNLEQAKHFINSVPIENLGQVLIDYPNFSIPMPHFESPTDEDLFLRSDLVQSDLQPASHDQLVGEIHIIPNGTFKMFYECGWMSNVWDWKINRTPTRCFDFLAPLIVPMAYLWQHFIDGTLPKIFQSYGILQRPEVKILIERPAGSAQNIYKMLDLLNLTDRVVFHDRGDMDTVYYARYMIHTCIAPPIHPTLWKYFRQTFHVSETRSATWYESKVILLKRMGTDTIGRRILNMRPLHDYLKNRYGDKLVIFYGGYSVSEAHHLFSQAKIIIGAHGGSFYNMQFAAKDTAIIEFAPLAPGGADSCLLPHTIFWKIAGLIGQNYWRIPIETELADCDMYVDIHKVHRILNIVDPNTKVTLKS